MAGEEFLKSEPFTSETMAQVIFYATVRDAYTVEEYDDEQTVRDFYTAINNDPSLMPEILDEYRTFSEVLDHPNARNGINCSADTVGRILNEKFSEFLALSPEDQANAVTIAVDSFSYMK